MADSKSNQFDRRDFLKGAAAGAAALAATPEPAAAAPTQAQPPAVALPSAQARVAETQPVPLDIQALVEDHPGSDFMVDVLKHLGFEYVAANPGSSFRSLHESIVNYGGNKAPELLTCCHEESSAFMACGYAKVEGKPMAIMAHSTVGLQHASIGVYEAFGAGVPVFIILGNTIDAADRRPGVEWSHSAQDAASMVRDYTKWDDLPISLTHFAESAVRGYKIAMTPPMGPVVLVADSHLQEAGVEEHGPLRMPRLTLARPPAADSGAVAELAKLLVAAENPVLLGGQAIRTPEGMRLLIELAETLQAPVSGGKFPSRHPLRQGGGAIRNADLVVGLDVPDFWGTVNTYLDQHVRRVQSNTRPGVKLVSLTSGDLYLKSNYQNFQRYTEVDMAIAADPEATLPSLLEAVKRLVTPDRQRAFAERGKRIAAASAQALEQARTAATFGWNESPISVPRLTAELWNAIKDHDWANVGGVGGGPLWNIDKHYQTIDGGGVSAEGGDLPTAVGAALAHRKHGRLAVSIQKDGDFMYAPGALWTAAHHRIPFLSVMHNNRCYHQEVMHIQRMANRHQRGITNAGIGNRLDDPNIDFAAMARAMGVHGEGPITNPNDLGPAIRRAVDVVLKGEPALVDVVSQPR
ncbi:MAG: twin-arginine translocation signal domain-containing protein [Acidobacteria bacterium]|nr:twin-arginine translocation signal domain-containing protein [Acidobacteriota bacterium]